MTDVKPVLAVADTSVLLAAFNRKDDHHARGVEALNVARILVISPLVMAELDHLLTVRAGEHEAINAVTRLGALAGQGRVQFPHVDRALLAEAEDLMRRHQGQALGLADCVNAALAWRLHRPVLLSFDHHYRSVIAPRRSGEKPLEVHPD
ncbi:PIN domain-containing protein [Kitasatospora sp. GP82]|uniref:type II toxin-antitoxin system VapC family toxin n=1 Tax=Kitasatospora sp. GP82 TaxID=3035089 RepID=UPI002472FCA2|nr:PIN domain-containing protein [Kitasatospora sp. GP82]MDH6130047.1 putative nucleic acid-binding protein [Kitasatospora sp. GP82]